MDLGRLHFVTGKGGVGKSTLAAAMATRLAEGGARVLAIDLSARAGLSALLGGRRDARASEQEEVAAGLFVTWFDGEVALAEYLQKRVRLGALLEVVLAHPLYGAFAGAAPGLRELMAIGKVRDELRRAEGGRRRWDAIVVDAGASGHALAHLRMPAAAARTFRSGLVHREASRIDALLRNPARTRVHVVALPEEMPLVEAAELVEAVDALRLPLGALVVNRCRERAPPELEDALGRAARLSPGSEGSRAVLESLRVAAARAGGWLRIQEEGIAVLEWRSGIAPRRLPRLAANGLGRAELRLLADALGGGWS